MTENRLLLKPTSGSPITLVAYAMAGASGACILALVAAATTVSEGGSLYFALVGDPVARLKLMAGLGAVFGVSLGLARGHRA